MLNWIIYREGKWVRLLLRIVYDVRVTAARLRDEGLD